MCPDVVLQKRNVLTFLGKKYFVLLHSKQHVLTFLVFGATVLTFLAVAAIVLTFLAVAAIVLTFLAVAAIVLTFLSNDNNVLTVCFSCI